MKTIKVYVNEDDVRYLLDVVQNEECRCKQQMNVEDGLSTEKSREVWAKRMEQTEKTISKVQTWMALLR